MSAVDRFAKRKALGLPAALPGPASTAIAVSVDPVAAADTTRLSLAIDKALERRRNERFDQRLSESKMVLLRSVAVPFGLGHLLSAYDRTGATSIRSTTSARVTGPAMKRKRLIGIAASMPT